MQLTEQTIDVDKILQSKMGDKAVRVPRFLVSWLKKTLHQDELNAFLWESRGTTGSAWLKDCLRFLRNEVRIIGEENLPPAEDPRRYTFVCNHPLGGIDGVAIGSVIGGRYNDNFRYLVNDILMNLPGLAPLCIPINKTGRQGRDFPRMVEEGFASDHHLVVFPAGLWARKISGEVHDLPWTRTFVMKSVQTRRDIVPVFFSGRNSERFYRIANLCKALRLKFNAAMLFLPDEMMRNRGKTFELHVGRPIPWQTFDGSRTPAQWAQWVQQETYQLAKEK